MFAPRLLFIGLIASVPSLPNSAASNYGFQSPGLMVKLAQDGEATGVALGAEKVWWNALGQSVPAGCRIERKAESAVEKEGRVRFKNKLQCDRDETRKEIYLVEV